MKEIRKDVILIKRTESCFVIRHGEREITPVNSGTAYKSRVYYLILQIALQKLNGRKWKTAKVIPKSGTARKLLIKLYNTTDRAECFLIAELLDGSDFYVI